ncbi:MAG TPA: hypothetical protein VFU19_11525 [Iamia sp.]|nr:hypothetical protein [Iamia sp.]
MTTRSSQDDMALYIECTTQYRFYLELLAKVFGATVAGTGVAITVVDSASDAVWRSVIGLVGVTSLLLFLAHVGSLGAVRELDQAKRAVATDLGLTHVSSFKPLTWAVTGLAVVYLGGALIAAAVLLG